MGTLYTPQTMTDSHRNTIHVESARVLDHQHFAGEQHVISLYAPKTAAGALPGSFVHVTCDPELPMRRPLSIMLTDPASGRVDLLYKAIGHGTKLLSRREKGEDDLFELPEQPHVGLRRARILR